MSSLKLSGVYTALVTPFKEGKVDFDAYGKLIDAQAAAGITGIIPAGTTGECATLTSAEHIEVIRFAVEKAAGRLEVVAGTGANSTSEAIDLTAEAESAGAHGTLQVTPYYNKPNQEGLFQHFKAIADSTKMEVMLYSVPGRCAVEIEPETAARLAAACSNITSIKEAGGEVDRVPALVSALPEEMAVLSGDDPLTLDFMKFGATGVVSVAANVIPSIMVAMVTAMQSGNESEARQTLATNEGIISGLMALDSNPIPVKAALAEMGLIEDEIRLPLTSLTGPARQQLRSLLKEAGLIQ